MNAPDPWGVAQWQDDGVLILHLYPARGREHALDDKCWCMPRRVESVNALGGRVIDFEHQREN